MKRPLLLTAAVLVLGIIILNGRAETRNGILCPLPALRAITEENDESFSVRTLTGTVSWIEKEADRVIFLADCGRDAGTVRVYKERTEEELAPYIGASVRFTGALFLFPEAENPGEFSVRRHYDNLGVFLGLSATETEIVKPSAKPLKKALFRLYEIAMQIIERNAETDDTGYFKSLLGLPEGEDSDALRKALSASFFVQLLSASGLLVSVLGIALYEGLRRMVKSKFLCASVPVFLMTLYFVFSGGGVSFLRALLLFSVRVFAPVFGRVFDPLSGFSFALILLLLTRPTYLFMPAITAYSAVFFSFSVVFPLLKRYFRKLLPAQSVLISLFFTQAVLLPWLLRNAYGFNLFGPVLTFALLPFRVLSTVLFGASVLFGILFGVKADPFVRFLFGSGHVLRRFLMALSELFSFGNVITGAPSASRVILYYLVLLCPVLYVFCALLRRKHTDETKERLPGRRARYFSCLLSVFLFLFGALFLHAEPFGKNELKVTALSVSQGESVIVRAGDFVLVSDLGSLSRDDTAEVLKNALYADGLSRIDVLLLTHADSDHTGGVLPLLREGKIRIGALWLPDVKDAEEAFSAIISEAARQEIPVRYVSAGMKGKAGKSNAEFTVYSPFETAAVSENETSVVLGIRTESGSVLLTGDISEETEGKIAPALSHYDILAVPHHGSRYSSSDWLLQKVTPDVSLISYGKSNAFGHPHEETVSRLLAYGSTVYGTGRSGAVSVILSGEKAAVRTYGKAGNNLPLQIP